MPIATKLIEKSSCVSWLNYSADAPDVRTEVRVKLDGGQLTVAHRTVNGDTATDWQELVTWLHPEAHEALADMFASPTRAHADGTPSEYTSVLVASAVQREIDDTVRAIREHEQLLASGACHDADAVAATLACLRRNLPAMQHALERLHAYTQPLVKHANTFMISAAHAMKPAQRDAILMRTSPMLLSAADRELRALMLRRRGLVDDLLALQSMDFAELVNMPLREPVTLTDLADAMQRQMTQEH